MISIAKSTGGFMSELYNTYLSVAFELQKHLKRRRLLIVAAIAVLIPLFFYISPPDNSSQFASTSLGFINILIAVAAAMFAGDAVSGEFENKIALVSFPTPQSRLSIFVGKYVASLLATFMTIVLFYLTMLAQISQLYSIDALPVELWQSLGIALIYATSAVSIVFFLSSVLKRSTSATILGFVSLMMILPVISMVLSRASVEPWFIVTYSAGLISNVVGEGAIIMEPGRGIMGPGRETVSSFEPALGTGIIIMLAYTVLGFISSMIFVNRKSVD